MRVFLLMLLFIAPFSYADITQQKVIDKGGSGPFKSIAATETDFPDYVVYRPVDITGAVSKEGKLPVMVFANGGCNDTSLPYERMLSEIASQGYLIVALGVMQENLEDRPLQKSPNEQMKQAIDRLTFLNIQQQSDYFNAVDTSKIAFAGQSCGGAQLLDMAADERVTSYIMFNSGIGDMTMAKADRSSLANLHAPVVYIIGGESDVAYPNALLDYERIKHVPVAFANAINGGHSGTFEEPYGGSFAKMALMWLDWQLKGNTGNARVFLQGDLTEFPDWTMQAKQF